MRCHAKGHIIAIMQCTCIMPLWAKIALYSLDLSLGINTFSHLVSVTYSILYYTEKKLPECFIDLQKF